MWTTVAPNGRLGPEVEVDSVACDCRPSGCGVERRRDGLRLSDKPVPSGLPPESPRFETNVVRDSHRATGRRGGRHRAGVARGRGSCTGMGGSTTAAPTTVRRSRAATRRGGGLVDQPDAFLCCMYLVRLVLLISLVKYFRYSETLSSILLLLVDFFPDMFDNFFTRML